MNLINTNRRSGFSLNMQIVIPILLISSLGLISLLSTVIIPSGGFGDLEIVYKQIVFMITGILFFVGISFLDLSYLKHWQFILAIYLFTLILLVITLFFGPTINYVNRWIIVAGIQIQPSEIAKITVILLTAVTISQKDKVNEWVLLLISFILTMPLVILVYLEPHASMAILILLIWFLISFLGLTNPLRNSILLAILAFISSSFLLSAVTGNSMWYLLLIPGSILSIFSFYSNSSWKKIVVITVALALILGVFSMTVWDNILQDYQKNRIEAFFNPTSTEDDIGFNVNQSRIAIGSGQIMGKGFGNGTQSKRNFLPEHQTDFIFASFAEEFGLVGSIFLMTLFGIIILSCFSAAMKSISNPMLSLIALGIGIKILFEVFINIGTNTGAIPATGIPLPLMSAGGSITMMTLICLGFINNILNSTTTESRDRSSDIVDFLEN